MKKFILAIVIVFIFGWLASNVYSSYSQNYSSPLSFIRSETYSPFDHIKEDQVYVYEDKVIINLENPTWARFADTNSMDPVIDIGANSIEVIPQNPEDIHVGDIVSYTSRFADGYIIHRVIGINEDEQGLYYTLKGDNNFVSDPEKVRFEQIKSVVVAILY